MILTAHQPVYLPWLGLFHKIALADLFCFFDDVQYQPKDWNNRNKIKFSNGKAKWLSVPVLRADYLEKSFLDIKINNATRWRQKHWKSIALNYKKSPYFTLYADALQEVYDREWEYLSELNFEMLRLFLQFLGIGVKVVRKRDYAFEGAKSELVLNMCRQLEADIYIFGVLGQDYADVEAFKQAGVFPYFQAYKYPEYPQIHGEFVSRVSILDLLFNCGPDSLEVLMSGNLSREELFLSARNGMPGGML